MIDDYMTLLPAHSRGLPRFSALAQAVLNQAEELMTLVPELAAGFSLTEAVGPQLDVVGASLGCDRADAVDPSDETYRDYLKAKLALWRWDGTNGSVTALLRDAFPGQVVSMMDNANMTVTGIGTGSLPGDPAGLMPVPAGVELC